MSAIAPKIIQTPAGKVLVEECRKGARSVRIVRAIEQKLRTAFEAFQPARPHHSLKPLPYSFSIQFQALGGANGHDCIVDLMTSGELRTQRFVFPDRSSNVDFKVSAAKRTSGAWNIASRHKVVSGSRANDAIVDVGADDDGFTALDDSGLFSGDIVKRGPEKLLMIEPDARDDGYFLARDVRGIQPAAQPDLQHGKFHPIAKISKCHRCHDLEVRRRIEQSRSAGSYGFRLFECDLEVRIRDLVVANANALVEPFKMRRSVKPYVRHHRREHPRHRSLPIRSRNKNRFEGILRVAQRGSECLHVP